MQNGHFASCRNPADCWCEAKRYGHLVVIGVGIFAIEIAGNLLSGSLSLLADAGHVVVCNASYAIAAFAAIAAKLGHVPKERAENGAFYALAIGLLVTACWILFEALFRLNNPPEVMGSLVIGVALIGGGLNWWQQRIHHEAPEEHKGHTHAAASLHILSDKYQSFAVALGGIAILATKNWWGGWRYIDPVLSGLIAVWLAFQVVELGQNFYNEKEHHR